MTAIAAAEVIIDLLQRGHAVEFRARGDSMHPVIREDDLLHVEPAQDVRIGDVVLTLAERGLTAHRVIALRDDAITTRGDNTPGADPLVSRARVLGKVLWIERDGVRSQVRRAPVALLFYRGIAAMRRLRRR